jgi:rhamnosyl/mannosyltransferase
VTRNEAFGLAQVEAMAAGKPIINCDIAGSGVPWVSEHLVSGLTVRVRDAAGMALAAQRLAEDDTLRATLSERARERALAMFDQERVIAEVTSAYLAVLSESTRSAALDAG